MLQNTKHGYFGKDFDTWQCRSCQRRVGTRKDIQCTVSCLVCARYSKPLRNGKSDSQAPEIKKAQAVKQLGPLSEAGKHESLPASGLPRFVGIDLQSVAAKINNVEASHEER